MLIVLETDVKRFELRKTIDNMSFYSDNIFYD